MPSHPDRVAKSYVGICELCLKNPIALFASRDYLAINRFNICEKCLERIQAEVRRDINA